MWRIKRWAGTNDGTLGRLTLGAESVYCLEEEDRENRRNVSRIPAGTYRCQRTWYVKGGYETFEIMHVPNRSRVLFHRGNTQEDTEGCVLVGLRVGTLKVADEDSGERKYKIAVLSSRKAFKVIMKSQEGKSAFWLDIEDED